MIDASGNLYGATANGGDDLKKRSCYSHFYNIFEPGCGTIFKITPKGEFSVLYRFHGSADGGTPVSVVLDPAGNLYGVTDTQSLSLHFGDDKSVKRVPQGQRDPQAAPWNVAASAGAETGCDVSEAENRVQPIRRMQSKTRSTACAQEEVISGAA